MAYVTIEEVMAEMETLGEDVDEDLLQRKVDAAQDIIERVCHRHFEAAADETRLIDVTDETVNGRTLTLPEDCCQITTILNGDADNTEITTEMYVTEPRLRSVSGGSSIMPSTPSAWPWYAVKLKMSSDQYWTYTDDPEEAVSITGRWAFSITPPATIKEATIRLADWLYHQKDNLAAETDIGDDGVTLLGSLPNDVQIRLKPFIRDV